MPSLRPYQVNLVNRIFAHWANGRKRVILQSGTGTGKTVMFNHIANLAEKKGKRVLIIADRRELITQAWTRLWEWYGVHAGIILSGTAPDYQLPVQIASIQTLSKRSFPPDIDIVIIDECRGSVSPSYAPIFAQYKDSYFLGVDATPIRTSGQGFDHLYDEMVIGPSIKEMEEQGALVPGKPLINPINQSHLNRLKITAGDYNEKALAAMMSDSQITAGLVTSKLKWAKGLRTMTFAVNLDHSKAIVEAYRNAGISATHVDGSHSIEERAQIFKDSKSGKIEVLCNVGITTYGYDDPMIMAIQPARPTKSLALYLQMVGRGSRPFPDKKPGKDHYLLLDHANLIMEHGLPNKDREWSLKGKAKTKKKQPPMFKVVQDGKERIVSAMDFPTGMEGIELEEVSEETLAFWGNCKEFDKVHAMQKRQGHRPLWAYFVFAQRHADKLGINELSYIARQLGFKPGWAHYKYRELQEKRALQHHDAD
jgi:superfamily II DNA or RNA helicase